MSLAGCVAGSRLVDEANVVEKKMSGVRTPWKDWRVALTTVLPADARDRIKASMGVERRGKERDRFKTESCVWVSRMGRLALGSTACLFRNLWLGEMLRHASEGVAADCEAGPAVGRGNGSCRCERLASIRWASVSPGVG